MCVCVCVCVCMLYVFACLDVFMDWCIYKCNNTLIVDYI